MSFIGLPLRLEMLATRKATWRVMSAYTYKGDRFSVAVPAAWVTDLTSHSVVDTFPEGGEPHTGIGSPRRGLRQGHCHERWPSGGG